MKLSRSEHVEAGLQSMKILLKPQCVTGWPVLSFSPANTDHIYMTSNAPNIDLTLNKTVILFFII